MISWLDQSDFEARFESEYRPNGRFLSEESNVNARLVELRARIPVAPAFTPASDGDFPGPAERWYGEVSSHLFLLTHYYEESGALTILTVEPASAARAAVRPAVESLLELNPYSAAD